MISDFYKLALSDSRRSYLLYLADPKMAAHWGNAMSQSPDGSRGSIALTLDWLQIHPATVRSEIQRNVTAIPSDLVVQAEVIASRKTSVISAWLYEVASIPAA